MEYKFMRSLVVMGQLAREGARTPPSQEGSPFAYVDQSLTILGRTFHTYDQRIRQEFLGQREFLASQFKGVEKKSMEVEENMDRRFKEVEQKMGGRFEEVEKRIDRRFKEVDEKMDGLDKKTRQFLDYMSKASRNFLRIRGWDEIYPVAIFDAHGGIHTPDHFPRTVRRFWSLKDTSQMDRLIYLLRFYDTQGYEEWGMDTDSLERDSSSDEYAENSSRSSRLPIPLEVAARSNPEIAHRALAAHLGLEYDGIQRFMERAQALGRTQVNESNKRRLDEQTSEEGKRRSKRSPEEDGTEITSPTEPPSSQ